MGFWDKRLRDTRGLWISKPFCKVWQEGKKSWTLASTESWVKPCNLFCSSVACGFFETPNKTSSIALYVCVCTLQLQGESPFVHSSIYTT